MPSEPSPLVPDSTMAQAFSLWNSASELKKLLMGILKFRSSLSLSINSPLMISINFFWGIKIYTSFLNYDFLLYYLNMSLGMPRQQFTQKTLMVRCQMLNDNVFKFRFWVSIVKKYLEGLKSS